MLISAEPNYVIICQTHFSRSDGWSLGTRLPNSKLLPVSSGGGGGGGGGPCINLCDVLLHRICGLAILRRNFDLQFFHPGCSEEERCARYLSRQIHARLDEGHGGILSLTHKLASLFHHGKSSGDEGAGRDMRKGSEMEEDRGRGREGRGRGEGGGMGGGW